MVVLKVTVHEAFEQDGLQVYGLSHKSVEHPIPLVVTCDEQLKLNSVYIVKIASGSSVHKSYKRLEIPKVVVLRCL